MKYCYPYTIKTFKGDYIEHGVWLLEEQGASDRALKAVKIHAKQICIVPADCQLVNDYSQALSDRINAEQRRLVQGPIEEQKELKFKVTIQYYNASDTEIFPHIKDRCARDTLFEALERARQQGSLSNSEEVSVNWITVDLL